MLILYIFGTVYVLCLTILVATLLLAKRQDGVRRPLATQDGDVPQHVPRRARSRRRHEPEVFRTAH
jgi:hypothetical protein